jgi:hypothetical protein
VPPNAPIKPSVIPASANSMRIALSRREQK